MPLIDSPPALRALALTTLLACAASLAGCREASAPAPQPAASAPAAPVATSSPATAAAPTKQQAMDTLMALPELKAWSAQIERESGGKLHGALIEYDTAPKIVNGKRYWQFSFVENGSDAAHRWESFLVGQSDADILVDDGATDTAITLAQWRKDAAPLQRHSAQ